MLNGLILGLDKKTVLNKTDEIIAFSELGDLIEHPIRIYSSGMLTRLGFSIVVHLAPEILLIDEILTAVGDIDFQKKCLNKIKEFQKNGVTIVLVSHNIEDVKNICDRVMWIDNHQVNMIGDTASVLTKYTLGCPTA